ncbi:Putative glycosyltransferase EpsE [Jannaschia seosinensis]|uniref:Putative glycosyltransferase EpsE n=1 Tax=Jannaschia seosinensis TaxID=313367 RepID=A0A0M7B6J0_9RHOB|nr:glycosyltransferase [Jannaschia seosinensis]CUH20550.1 Putative glycosyltransferase EpsE [Jannaschia seosinensis]
MKSNDPGDPVRLSVVMPVFNAAQYLPAALDSVLNQDFSDFEFLVHDDGSQDDSWAILTDYAGRDPRMRISQGLNQGLPRTLNQMINLARGELIARFDADDLCLPTRFEKQISRFDCNSDLVVLGGAAQIVDAAGRPITVKSLPLSHLEIDGLNLRGKTSFQHPSVMMRRDAVLAVGGYHPDFHGAEDHDLWLRMAEIGQLENLPDVLIKYRIHAGSISSTKRDLQRQLCLCACEAAWQRRGISDGRFEYQEWRMGDDAQSQLSFNINYAWQAWSHGYRGSWRHYALKALRQAPLSKAAWNVLLAGALRRPRIERPHD